VDEVLAVGDAAFQKKCLGKMGAVAKEGRTVLFVSHNMNAISNLCGKVILLLNGRVENYGAPRKMIDKYLSVGITNIMRWQPSIVLGKAFFFNAVWIDLNRILIESGGLIAADSPFEVFFEFHVLEDISLGRLAIKILNQEGVVIFSAADTDETPYLNHPWLLGRHVISCVIPGNFLTPGRYYLSVAVSGKENSLIIHENVLTFIISENGSLTVRDGRPGVVAPKLRWKTHDV
jgi:lipopolysaccharide transport system ATP-binding protein